MTEKPEVEMPPKLKATRVSVMHCGCIERFNKYLAEKNTAIDVGLSLDFATGNQSDCLLILTHKLDPNIRPTQLYEDDPAPTNCPLCERPYE